MTGVDASDSAAPVANTFSCSCFACTARSNWCFGIKCWLRFLARIPPRKLRRISRGSSISSKTRKRPVYELVVRPIRKSARSGLDSTISESTSAQLRCHIYRNAASLKCKAGTDSCELDDTLQLQFIWCIDANNQLKISAACHLVSTLATVTLSDE
eukprot:6180044-Pleurochrysis_carterae.AAC.2